MALRAADHHKIPIDPNGNLTSKTEGTDTWVYTWNAENQLTKVEKNGTEVARFAYDPIGRRVEKIAGGVTTAWTYDDDEILRQTLGASVVKYIHGPRTDEALAADDGTTLTYLHADGLASIVKTTAAGGAVTLTREYDAWGEPLAGESQSGYAYTGREWDLETGLYYYRVRYYDPTIARFISSDPIEFEGGPNFYSYVGNRPTVAVDPFGLKLVCMAGSGAPICMYFPDPSPPPPSRQCPCGSGGPNTQPNTPGDPFTQFGAGTGDVWRNFRRMEERGWVGADKWYHCMAMCQATNEGPGGAAAAKFWSFARTTRSRRTEPNDWQYDEQANQCGQKGGNCQQRCAPLVPKSSPGRPPFPGW